MENSILVAFDEELLHKKNQKWWSKFNIVIGPKQLRSIVPKEIKFLDLKDFLGSGSIYEASRFIEELSSLALPDGSRVSKSFIYKGYELWWIYYNSLFLFFCLPYTQYKKLLEYVKNFKHIYFYKAPNINLFSCYLDAYNREVFIIRPQRSRFFQFLPFGVFVQIIITMICIPILILQKRRIMLFTGDKFDAGKDYDFRMKFIYEELRGKGVSFVEFIRSLESWKTIFGHALKRKRPIIYSEAIIFLGKFFGFVTGGCVRARLRFGAQTFSSITDPSEKFKFLLATRHILGVYNDVWAIRIMKWILRIIGVKVALIPAATERNFHSVLACKLIDIPTIGILHGVASRFYNGYDFLPTYDGTKRISVDKYGLWSDWWKKYYIKHSKVYSSDQLYVSGPMRPLENTVDVSNQSQLRKEKQTIKILFVPGELSNPEEIIPYLEKLMTSEGVSVYLTFRPYRDRFENWLNENNPQLIEKLGKDKILLGDIHDAIAKCDVVVGSYSTGSLEALLQLKPVIFFHTVKWGDYFEMKDYDSKYKFFAENPEELINLVIKRNETPTVVLKNLQERFFGNPYQDGSKWMVEEALRYL